MTASADTMLTIATSTMSRAVMELRRVSARGCGRRPTRRGGGRRRGHRLNPAQADRLVIVDLVGFAAGQYRLVADRLRSCLLGVARPFRRVRIRTTEGTFGRTTHRI